VVQKLRNIKPVTLFTTHGDNIVPYFHSIKQDNLLQELPATIRECVSLVRLRQNPCAEILGLWSQQDHSNPCFCIPVLREQWLVPQTLLRGPYERVAVEVVNAIGAIFMPGIDINELVAKDHYHNMLQFVCGLGPRKSRFIIDTIKKKMGSLKFRMQLWVDKLMAKTVYVNAIGFIKVGQSGTDEERDVLDGTRIHPENYVLAKKIAKDALDVEKDDKDECVSLIMAQNHKLDDLDMEDYAEHLAQVKMKPNMITLLQFIVQELTNPFKDPRQPNQEMEDHVLFYKLLKENEWTFRKSSIVNCRVIKVYSL